MRFSRLRFVVCSLVVGVALAGCAAKTPLTDKPVVRKIALIPASEPLEFTLGNATAFAFISPLVETGIMLSAKAKAKEFSQKMAARHVVLAPRLTTIVVDSLRAAGYTVDVLDDIARDPEDPDDIDYGKLETDAEVIVQLRIREVGVFSPRSSSDYHLPRVNVDGKLYIHALDDAPYDETLYYGVDAQSGNAGAIKADAKLKYANFDAVMAKTDELQATFENATDALARLLATQLKQALVARTRAAPR